MSSEKKYLNVLKSAVSANRKHKIDKEIFKTALEHEQVYISKINTAYLNGTKRPSN